MESTLNTIDPLAPLPSESQPEKPAIQNSLSTYSVFDTQFTQLCKDWQLELRRTNAQRQKRFLEVDHKKLRADGKLKDDEVILPIRVADRNIRREQPAYIAFLTQSRRSLIFRERKSSLDIALGTANEEHLEQEFTQGMRYPNWELAPYAATDGAQTHGWDACEVVYDDTKPLKVAIEHVGHDKLLFPTLALDIQHCEYVARGYDLTGQQLTTYVEKFGFSADQVKQLTEADADTGWRTVRLYRVWKILFREDGIIKVAWRCDVPLNTNGINRASTQCTDWLKPPAPLYLGRTETKIEMQPQPPKQEVVIDPMNPSVAGIIVEIPQPAVPVETQVDAVETEFPIYVLRYHQTENMQIFSTRGRVFLDSPDQEAQTAIASGFVNKLMRSTNVYGAVNSDATPGSSAAPKQLGVKLEHGKIYDRPINFFSADAPDPSLLNALQWFGVRNAEENGQTDFAVQNRQDSRKTATEIQAASQQASLLSGVQVTIYSTWICSFYTRAWQIVQNLAQYNKLEFLVDPQTGQNKTDVISKFYYTRAAGDIDVTQRAEKLQKMMQLWGVIAQTPAAPALLRNILITALPDEGPQLVQVIQDDTQTKQLLATCATLLQQLVISKPDDWKELQPQEQQQLLGLQQQVQQCLSGGQSK
jgi:hypothetical protein